MTHNAITSGQKKQLARLLHDAVDALDVDALDLDRDAIQRAIERAKDMPKGLEVLVGQLAKGATYRLHTLFDAGDGKWQWRGTSIHFDHLATAGELSAEMQRRGLRAMTEEESAALLAVDPTMEPPSERVITTLFLSSPLRLPDRPVVATSAPSYGERFRVAVAACGFTWWSQERLTAGNFPGETFDGGDYDLEWRRLPSKSDGYNGEEIDAVVLNWTKDDATILGAASAGDGLFLAKEFKEGRRDQPSGWIVCSGSASVDGELLCLRRGDLEREACVHSRDCGWYGGGFVLLRKVRKSA